MKREDLQEMTQLEKIEYYATITDMISVNSGNRKTGKACLTMSFPTCSCRDDAPCKVGCYCSKGPQKYSSVQGAYFRNWRLWREDSGRFEEQLNALLTFNCLPLFRYCDSGDIPDLAFFGMMLRVALKHPEIKFLAYTKKYDLINETLETYPLPDNLTIRFSYWDKSWKVPNPHNLPIAYVNFKDISKTPEIPKNAYLCKGGEEYTCSMCKACFNKKVTAVQFNQH